MKCCICLDCLICKNEAANKPLSSAKCGHLFHTECITKYFSSLPPNCWQCPLCRKPILNDEEIQHYIEFECDCKLIPIVSNKYFNYLSQYEIKNINDIKSKTEILSDIIEEANSKTDNLTSNLFKLTVLTLSELTELLSEKTKKIAQLEQLLKNDELSSSKEPCANNKKVTKLSSKLNRLSFRIIPKKSKNNAQKSEIQQDLELQLATYKSYVEQYLGLDIDDIIDDTSSISTKYSELSILDN